MPTLRAAARRLALVLLVAAPLGGCRDPLVNEPLVPPSEAPSAVRSLYIKGATATMALGARATLRSQGHPAAVRYEWDFGGEGEVRRETASANREARIRATRTGGVTAYVVAYDAAGAIVGRGSRPIEIVL